MAFEQIGKVIRADGRSNSQVLLDLFKTGVPGQVYTYAELMAALGAGAGRTYSRATVCAICARMHGQPLKHLRRALENVPNVGYRLAESRDHSRLALNRKKRADRQLYKGLQTVRHVHRGELTAEERAVHDSTLTILSTQHEQAAAFDRRRVAASNAIRKLVGG